MEVGRNLGVETEERNKEGVGDRNKGGERRGEVGR